MSRKELENKLIEMNNEDVNAYIECVNTEIKRLILENTKLKQEVSKQNQNIYNIRNNMLGPGIEDY